MGHYLLDTRYYTYYMMVGTSATCKVNGLMQASAHLTVKPCTVFKSKSQNCCILFIIFIRK